MRKGFIAFLSLLLVSTLTFSIRTVHGHTWNQEDRGEAALVKFGTVPKKVADYIRPGTLKLGGVCGLYYPGWLTAEGRMDVYGFATASGQVTGWISWWQKGTLAASGFKWIEIKFQALDINEDDLTEKVVLFVNATSPNPNWEDFGTQYTEDMNIYLTEGHLYKFSLYVLVEVKGGGQWTAVADFGGVWWSDSRIEWRYINVPNTAPVDIWPDVLDAAELPNPVPGHKDGWVTGLDFAWVALPKYIFTRRDQMKPWPDPPGAWGPHCDVNFDRKIGIADLMKIGVNYGDPWPPPGGGSSQSYAYFEASSANVSVYPVMVVAALGKNFTVNITVSNVTDLYGWEFWMSFNSTILTAVNVTEGPFLKAAGDTFWTTPKINNTAGTIAAGAMLDPPPSQGATGNGIMATITFYVQSDGTTSLNFSDTELNTVIGGDVLPMNHTANNGYVSTTIQAAVDRADTKDTVYVTEGTYHEHVTVNKSLTLIGENIETTIIDGSGTDDVLLILANNTNISGFTITNGSTGIHLYNTHKNTISSNIVSNSEKGIHLEQSSKNNITGNKISNNNVGIELKSSSNNAIYHNNFISNIAFQAKSMNSLNTWDDGSKGNYWSDYTGKDENGDGIGDTPYVINGQNKDNYPLMQPWSP